MVNVAVSVLIFIYIYSEPVMFRSSARLPPDVGPAKFFNAMRVTVDIESCVVLV